MRYAYLKGFYGGFSILLLAFGIGFFSWSLLNYLSAENNSIEQRGYFALLNWFFILFLLPSIFSTYRLFVNVYKRNKLMKTGIRVPAIIIDYEPIPFVKLNGRTGIKVVLEV